MSEFESAAGPEHIAWAPDLTILRADNAGPMTLDGTRTYVLGRERVVVVDPGPDDRAQLDGLVAAVDRREVAFVLLTHAHADHAAGAARTAARFETSVGASASTLERLGIDGRPLTDGERLTLDFDAGLTALGAPGHSADHMCYLADPGRRLFTGDLVLGEGSSAILHPDGSVGATLASLARLIALRPALLLPGHGPPVEEALPKLEEYRRHRLEREGQILAALAGGSATVPEIRANVYGPLPAGLTWAADASIAAHLARLAENGVTVPDYDGYGSRGEEPA